MSVPRERRSASGRRENLESTLRRTVRPLKLPITAVLPVILAGTWIGCGHSRTDTRDRTEKLTRMLNKERTARRLAELEKEILKLRNEVAKKNQLLGRLAGLDKSKAKKDGSSGEAKSRTDADDRTDADNNTGVGRGGSGPVARFRVGRAGLQMRIVGYRNRQMVVEVYNNGTRPEVFTPKGLYFVPVGDPRKTYQRMGAAGPYEVYKLGVWRPAVGPTSLPAYSRNKFRLQLFCLDQGRRWPNDHQRFRVARGRLPKPLLRSINSGVKRIMRGRRSYRRAPRAKRKVQDHIWRSRRMMPSPLDGD